MSAAPFRELFTELPAAVFEMLQGIGEAAVRQAQPASPSRAAEMDVLVDFLRGGSVVDMMRRHFGWKNLLVHRRERSAEVIVRAVLDCGHVAQGMIDEDGLSMFSSGEVVDQILADLERVEMKGRRCYCVRRPE